MFPRVLLVFFLLSEISAHGIDEDLVITWEQKEKLDEFRTIMEPHLPHDYMKTDIYLIRWLKARNYEIPAASRMLQENLWWREENEMDALLDEDWTEFNNQYRFNLDGCDGNGAPVFVLFAGEWDMRRAALAGQSEKMRRYIDKCFEEASTVLRNMQARGSNATRANLILDLGSLSFQVQACPRCIPFYLYLVQSLGAHFPNLRNLRSRSGTT
ncbi:SEC14-like protein 4 isoform X3 [Folsomia candida]|uniref:SEC14-like protein 4 isoform X3 n=1 Tax=Folsomia candida TaxID=158441 RepID=UPI001604BF9E|nr:SEC14-like protein 4 isoform X3 [Folsomia candida]